MTTTQLSWCNASSCVGRVSSIYTIHWEILCPLGCWLKEYELSFKKLFLSPDWWGSVDGALSWKAKDCWLDSHSGTGLGCRPGQALSSYLELLHNGTNTLKIMLKSTLSTLFYFIEKWCCASFLGTGWMRNIMNQIRDNIIFLSCNTALWFTSQNLWKGECFRFRTGIVFFKLLLTQGEFPSSHDRVEGWASPRAVPCLWSRWPHTCTDENSLCATILIAGLPMFPASAVHKQQLQNHLRELAENTEYWIQTNIYWIQSLRTVPEIYILQGSEVNLVSMHLRTEKKIEW